MIVYLQTLTYLHVVNSNLKSIFAALIVVLAVPLDSFATSTDPKTDSDKAVQEKPVPEDSIGFYDLENKVDEGFQLEDRGSVIQESANTEKTTSTYNPTTPAEKIEDLENPNSAMSFNFIYYIIDKFKLADPLD